MTELLVAWVVCPALLVALFTGIGLGVAAVARGAIPLALVPLCGLAASAAVGGVLAALASGLILPALLALAAAGALAGRAHLRRPGWWALAVPAGAFTLYAAPVVLAGEATFAGYIKLDDTATWLALTDRIMDGGTNTDGLAASSYEATLAINFANGYPVGGFVPLGFAVAILGTDPAWLLQPYMALVGALLALALWDLVRRAIPAPPVRALVAITAACPALLVGFYLWGGVKEMLTALLVAAIAASAAATPAGFAWRSLLPLGVLGVGLVATASVGALLWALPALGLVVVRGLLGAPPGSRRIGLLGAALLATGGVGALLATGSGLSPFRDSFTNQADLGNLAGPLEPAQLAGIWPASDFRFDPGAEWFAFGLVALAVMAAIAGVADAARRRDTALALYPLGTAAVCAAVAVVASPWLDAKAFAIASPAVLLAAVTGMVRLRPLFRRMAVGGTALLVAGVGWSLVTQWGGANLAPRDQLVELEQLGERLAGGGPTLMTEYQPYGVRHFLRDADPEGASELRRRTVPLLDGGSAQKGRWVDTDELDPAAFSAYDALVLRRSPEQSRPPGEFELAWAGEFYELWTRDPDTSPALMRLPLGDGRTPVAVPRCAEVRALASQAPGGELLAARAPQAERTFPPRGGAWTASGNELEVWVKGSVRGAATLLLDSEPVAATRHELNNSGLYTSFGTVSPVRGRHHELRLDVGGADLHPGSAPDGTEPGRIVLRRPASDAALRRVPATDARALCRAVWDWVEVRR